MIIGIDASRAFSSQPTGIQTYTFFVIQHLRIFLSQEDVVLYIKKNTVIPFPLPSRWKVREISWKYLWTQGGLSWEMFRRPVDVLFVPAHTLPWVCPRRSVVTIHGLEYERCPLGYSWCSRFYMRFFIQRSCKKASSLIAVSQITKKDIGSFYKVDTKKVRVIYEGPGNERLQEKKVSSQKKKPYFLCIGRLEYRKNIVRMIRAFECFKKKYKTDYQLLLVGSPGYGYSAIQKAIKESPFRKDIIEKGYVKEEEKQYLFDGADAFLFLSHAEGFGLPLLEAQAKNIPLVVSDIPIMHEIAGEGAYFVKKDDMYEIARNMHEISKNDEKKRGILEKGRKNVVRFSWERCAREIAEVLLKKREPETRCVPRPNRFGLYILAKMASKVTIKSRIKSIDQKP